MSTTTNGAAEADYSVIKFTEDYVASVSDLPAITVQRAIQRTLNHVLGNEVASAVGSAIDKLNADRVKAGEPELEEDELESEKARLTKEYRDEKFEAFTDGTWGLSMRGSSGPRVSAFETEYTRLLAVIAKTKLKAAEKNNGAVYDKTAKNWTFYRMENGEKVVASVRTIDSTIEEVKASTLAGTIKQREEAADEARRIVEMKQRRADIAKMAEPVGGEAFSV